MKAEEITTLDDAQNYCEGVLNDLEAGILQKDEALVAFYEYTVRIHNLFASNLDRMVKERVLELYEQSKEQISEVFYCWDEEALGKRCSAVCEQCFVAKPKQK